jgi:hypothetical protein
MPPATILIQFSGVAGQGVVKAGEGDFNGFQLTAVPEPSTWKAEAFVLALLTMHLGRRRAINSYVQRG